MKAIVWMDACVCVVSACKDTPLHVYVRLSSCIYVSTTLRYRAMGEDDYMFRVDGEIIIDATKTGSHMCVCVCVCVCVNMNFCRSLYTHTRTLIRMQAPKRASSTTRVTPTASRA
jgi:hypothetical protein